MIYKVFLIASGFITSLPVSDSQLVERAEAEERARKKRAKTVVVGRPPLVLLLSRFFSPVCSFVPSLGTDSMEQSNHTGKNVVSCLKCL